MKAVIYLRVSTREQDNANQLAECLELANARGWGTAQLYEEVASGVAKSRPVWEQVKNLARVGKIGAVIVWSLDRVGRSMFRTIADVGELADLGVRVVSVREPWLDTGGPSHGLLLAVFAWVAQHEHERIRERTRAGLERARAEGRVPGRPRVEISPQALHRARLLAASGMGRREVARQLSREGLGDFNHLTLQRALEGVVKKG